MTRSAAERRRFERIDPGDQAFVVIKGEPSERVCQIIDISMGGMCFRYFDTDVDTDDIAGLDLYFVKRNLVLRKLPFVTVYEQKEMGRNPFSALLMSRVGIRFHNLTPSCESLMEEFVTAFSDPADGTFPDQNQQSRFQFLKAIAADMR